MIYNDISIIYVHILLLLLLTFFVMTEMFRVYWNDGWKKAGLWIHFSALLLHCRYFLIFITAYLTDCFYKELLKKKFQLVENEYVKCPEKKKGEQQQQSYISDKLWKTYEKVSSSSSHTFLINYGKTKNKWTGNKLRSVSWQLAYFKTKLFYTHSVVSGDFFVQMTFWELKKSIPNQLISKKTRKASDRLDNCDLSSDKETVVVWKLCSIESNPNQMRIDFF